MNLINGIETDFRFAGIDKFNGNNGKGVGATLYVQVCSTIAKVATTNLHGISQK